MTKKIFAGSLTALVIARLLVAGDDPGRLRLTAGGGPLTLNLLLLVLLLAWSAWNGVRRGSATVGGPVTFCLLTVAGFFFLSNATVATYKRPGWFIAWEWVAVAAIFYLVRRLTDIPGASTGLLSAILATAVSFSGVTVYQALSGTLGLPSAEVVGPAVTPSLVGDGDVSAVEWPWSEFPVRFGQPLGSRQALIAFLLVLLPLLLCAGWLGLRDRSRRGFLVAGCGLLAVVACGLELYRVISDHYSGPTPQTEWRRQSATWHDAMGSAKQTFWQGFGPQPAFGSWWNAGSWFAVAQSAGMPALVMLFAAIGLVGWAVHRAKPRPFPTRGTDEPVAESGVPATRWEFYIGGVVGLLLGFILSTGDIPAEMPPGVLVHVGVVAALRSVVWFAVFALFEAIVWRPVLLAHCLLVGLGFASVFGCVSQSLILAPVLWTFWAVAAVALNLMGSPGSRGPKAAHPFAGWAVAPIALVLLIGNLIQVAVPGLVTADAVRDARDASRHLPDQEREIAKLRGTRRQERIWQADRYLNARVLEPLRQAARRDADNAPLLLELARLSRLHWHDLMALHDEKAAADLSRQILQWTDRATKLDADGGGSRGTAEALLLFVAESRVLRKERVAVLEKTLDEGHVVDATELRYRLMKTLLELVERRPKGAKSDDRTELIPELDRVATQVLRREQNNLGETRIGFRLSEAECRSLVQRLRAAIPEPSAELHEQLDMFRK